MRASDLELSLKLKECRLLELKTKLKDVREGSPQWETLYEEYKKIESQITSIMALLEFNNEKEIDYL